MSAPETKEQWREFCAFDPTPDDRRPRLTAAEMSELTHEELRAYNQRRAHYITEERTIPTANLLAIEKMTRRALLTASSKRFVARRAISVSGPPRSGKSTAVMHAGKRLEHRIRSSVDRIDDPSYLPIVYVSITAATTANKLWSILAEFVGTRQLRGRNVDDRMFSLTQLLRELGTKFVILDEVQRLDTERISGAEVADTIKSFAESVDATMIYAGISLQTAPLFTGAAGEQWRARTVPYTMRPYSIGTPASLREWQELVATFESYLPLTEHVAGSLVADSQYLFHRTGGSIASLRDIIADAAIDVIDTGDEKITRSLLDDIPVDANAALFDPEVREL